MREHPTIIAPAQGEPATAGSSAGLPLDLLGQSAERLRILALLYAFTFFMAGIFPTLVLPAERARFLSELRACGARAMIGIIVAVLVAVVIRSPRCRSGGDEARPGLRDRQQLCHRRRRVR